MSDQAPERGDADKSGDEEPERAPRRKRKRRAATEEGARATTEASEAEATEEPSRERPEERADRPAFALGFPQDPELDALVVAFEAGDLGRVRREAPELAKKTDRDEVRAAARELRRRVDPDPLAVYLLGIAAALLVFLAGWYWLHPHAP